MRVIVTKVVSAIHTAGSALRRYVRSVPARASRSTGILPVILNHGRDAHAAEMPDAVTTTGVMDPAVLNARVRIGREPDGDSWRSTLIIEVCGTIEALDDNDHEVAVQVALSDATDTTAPPLPVLQRPKHGPLQGSSYYVFQNPMGKLCRRTTVLEDWATVAQISPSGFVLPRQGSRLLQCDVSIILQASGQRLAFARGAAVFENTEIGYLDIEDNIQRAKTLGVALAFSVAAADNQLPDSEILVITGWARTNFGSAQASAAARLELDRALQKTAAFFRKGGRLNVQDICREIVEIAPMVGRIEIMDLCLRVAGAKGQVTSAEILQLKDLAGGLAIDRARLRTMVEKILPVHMHASQDSEMILGVTEDMSKDEARLQLNREYAKWSSRVISTDPSIRKQADQMLNLLANARTQYVGLKPVAQKS
jgi:hypothetical protein